MHDHMLRATVIARQTQSQYLQDEARRLAEQVHVLGDTRNRWNGEVAAKEASLAAKEESLADAARQRDADQRRHLAQEQQVSVYTYPIELSQCGLKWKCWEYSVNRFFPACCALLHSSVAV